MAIALIQQRSQGDFHVSRVRMRRRILAQPGDRLFHASAARQRIGAANRGGMQIRLLLQRLFVMRDSLVVALLQALDIAQA